jgi:hypothetical protein
MGNGHQRPVDDPEIVARRRVMEDDGPLYGLVSRKVCESGTTKLICSEAQDRPVEECAGCFSAVVAERRSEGAILCHPFRVDDERVRRTVFWGFSFSSVARCIAGECFSTQLSDWKGANVRFLEQMGTVIIVPASSLRCMPVSVMDADSGSDIEHVYFIRTDGTQVRRSFTITVPTSQTPLSH